MINDSNQEAAVREAAAPTTTSASPLHRGWSAFTHFRRTRPFWGALILAAGGYFVGRPLLGAGWGFYTSVGAHGLTPIILGGGMVAAAAISLIVPAQRHFPSIIAMMLSVASLPLANLGGWLIGMLLGIVGSGLCFAWAPYSDKQLAKYAAREQRRAARRAARRHVSDSIAA